MRVASLRLKLFKTLMVALLFGWLVLLGCQYLQLRDQQSNQGDLMLREVAEQILLSMPPDIAETSDDARLRLPADQPAAPIRKFGKLQFQIWRLDRHQEVAASLNAPATPLKPDFQPGFGQAGGKGEPWRVFAVSDAHGRVQVQTGVAQAQLQAELAHWIGSSLGYAIGVLLLLAAAIWLAVHWALRPINRLRDGMARRQPLDLTPLPSAGIAGEIRPLVDSFNALLARLDTAMQAEHQFLADAAHEIRTPLAALLTQAELAQRAQGPEQARQALQRLAGGIERTSRLAQQLLDAAHLDVSQRTQPFAPLELADVAGMVAREFEGMASRRQQVLALTAREAPVLGQLDDLGILLRNLVDNAVRYAGTGARIEIDCHGDPAGACLRVRDNGAGVPEAERARIFERFFRGSTGNGERGSGIGLSLVARIAASHRATLAVEDGLGGRGLGISVRFPPPQ